MSLLKRNVAYKPFSYPWAVELAKKSEQMHWIESEIDFKEDLSQWGRGVITDDEKKLIVEIMKTFTQSDVEVATGYIENFMPVFKNNEIRQMLVSFAAREGIHQRAYALFTDTIGIPESDYSAFTEYEQMAEKIENMTKMDMSTKSGIAHALARTLVSEGISLFGAFVMLLNFQRHGKMAGLSKINEWSIKDESLHCEGVVQLYQTFLKENPEIVCDEFKSHMYTMVTQAVELEDSFVDIAYGFGQIEGLPKQDVKDYLRYIGNIRLNQLGLKKIWDIEENPCPWISGVITSDSMTSFLEQKVTEYAVGGLTGDWGW